MRRLPFLTTLLAVAVLALASVQLGTNAQTGTPPADGQGFVGAWRLTSENPSGASQSLLTLMADGTIVFSGRPRRRAENPRRLHRHRARRLGTDQSHHRRGQLL